MKTYLSKLLVLLLVLLLIGCTDENTKEIKITDEYGGTKPVVIATLIPEFESYIQDTYAKFYGSEITTKPILSSVEEVNEHWSDLDVVIEEFLNDNQDVDLIYAVSPEYLNALIEKGALKNLSEELDESITSKLAPVFTDPMKQIGDGNLYAIASSFTNHALVYNKEIFKEVGVQEPKSGMTWEEISDLAAQIRSKSNYEGFALEFPSDDEQYYYYFQQNIISVGNYEKNKEKAILNTETNRKYWPLFANMYKDNAKVTGEDFVKGNVAMGVFELNIFLDDSFVGTFGELNKSQWGLVAMPITPENPGSIMFSEEIFAMSKYSNNKEAVKFLESIHGKEFAKILVENSLLPTYFDINIKQQLQDKYGYDLTPVYIQPGIVYDQPQFNGTEYNVIKNTGAEYFLKYLNGDEDINKILTEYENAVN